MAAENKHLNFVNFLLKNGADVTFLNNSDIISLHLAAKHGDIPTVEQQLTKKTYEKMGYHSALHWASDQGHAAVVVFLLQNIGNLIEFDRNGFSPLHLAARSGHLKICQLLLENGSNVNVGIKGGGKNSLHYLFGS